MPEVELKKHLDLDHRSGDRQPRSPQGPRTRTALVFRSRTDQRPGRWFEHFPDSQTRRDQPVRHIPHLAARRANAPLPLRLAGLTNQSHRPNQDLRRPATHARRDPGSSKLIPNCEGGAGHPLRP